MRRTKSTSTITTLVAVVMASAAAIGVALMVGSEIGRVVLHGV